MESLGVSATYLNQKFKNETTYTFNDFLNRYRIQKAMDLLRSGEDKVYAVAADVGYKDYKYFIAIFKKYAGCTPSYDQERYGGGEKSGEASGDGDAKQADRSGGSLGRRRSRSAEHRSMDMRITGSPDRQYRGLR